MPSLPALPRLVLAALLALAGPWPQPAGATDLYTGEALVASQDAAERERALGPALVQVLVKVSGDPRVGQHPGIDGELPVDEEAGGPVARELASRAAEDSQSHVTSSNCAFIWRNSRK